MSRLRVALASLVAVLAVTTAACTQQEPEFTAEDQVAAADRPEEEAAADDGEAAPAEEADETLTFVAVDNDYTEFPTEASAGTVAFELDNQGNLHHDVTIEELGDQMAVEADGGATETGTVSLEPGTYTVYCSVPGHRATMEEQLTVQ